MKNIGEKLAKNSMFILISCLGFIACGSDEIGEQLVLVESIEVIGADITNGTTSQMTVTILPANASEKSVSWQSSDETIATVSQNGLVEAKKNGVVIITAQAVDRGATKGIKQIAISSFETSDPDPASSHGIEVNNPAELIDAISKAQPGDSIIVVGGTYALTNKIVIARSGSDSEKISLVAKPGDDRPLFDFSSMAEGSSNQGMVLDADFWNIYGIDVYNAGDNGMQVKGNNNIIEFCTFSECSDSGLQLDNGASNNTILNCDSYFNADSKVENADGFACKLTVGSGNKFVGCRAWKNLDDGWDGYLRDNDNISTTYENCWAIKNGYLKDGLEGGGDGNGFKTGGSDDKLLKHNAFYANCLAIGNAADGFDHNSNRGTVTLYNCAAYDNGKNLNFSSTNPLEKLIIKNCAVLGTLGSLNASETEITNNSWMEGIVTSEADFQSVQIEQLTAPRKSDGSLPDVTFMHLVSSSDLIDKGVDVGLPFNGAAPDLGAFEYKD